MLPIHWNQKLWNCTSGDDFDCKSSFCLQDSLLPPLPNSSTVDCAGWSRKIFQKSLGQLSAYFPLPLGSISWEFFARIVLRTLLHTLRIGLGSEVSNRQSEYGYLIKLRHDAWLKWKNAGQVVERVIEPLPGTGRPNMVIIWTNNKLLAKVLNVCMETSGEVPARPAGLARDSM